MNQISKSICFALVALCLTFNIAEANSVSVSIQSLSPSTNISVGTNLSFTVQASGFANPSYSLTDSFSGGTVTSSNINSAGGFSWTPNGNDIGSHTLSIAVSDSLGDTATTTEQITVTQTASLSIQSLSPSSSIQSGTNLSFTAVTSGLNNPTYSLSDSFSGSSLTNSNINSGGNFNWTPVSQDTGTHTITITTTEPSSGRNATAAVTITVNGVGGAQGVQIESVYPSANITVGQSLSFTTATSGFTGSIYYNLSDSFSGSSVTSSDLNAGGNFYWTPVQNDIGNHTITVSVIDQYGHSGSASQTFYIGAAIIPQGSVSNPYTYYGGCLPGYTYNVTNGAPCSNIYIPPVAPASVSTVTATSTTYRFTTYLKPGMKSTAVTELQKRLTALHLFSGPITGLYGTLTEKAVKVYQKKLGLEQIGVVGPATRAALNK